MPNRRIYPDHVLTTREMNLRHCLPLFLDRKCRYCKLPNDRHPKIMCSVCEKARSIKSKSKLLALKKEVFLHYGGVFCCCCDEEEITFLTLDHYTVTPDAFTQRGGDRLYRELRLKGYPPGFRVLCFNCNIGRWINGGTCPHKK